MFGGPGSPIPRECLSIRLRRLWCVVAMFRRKRAPMMRAGRQSRKAHKCSQPACAQKRSAMPERWSSKAIRRVGLSRAPRRRKRCGPAARGRCQALEGVPDDTRQSGRGGAVWREKRSPFAQFPIKDRRLSGAWGQSGWLQDRPSGLRHRLGCAGFRRSSSFSGRYGPDAFCGSWRLQEGAAAGRREAHRRYAVGSGPGFGKLPS